MKRVFVAGTDTGVGKTVVAGLLARYLLKIGHSVVTQKWVETGTRGYSHDVEAHLKLMGRSRGEYREFLSHMSPYSFNLASSPHLASKAEGGTIDLKRLRRGLDILSGAFDIVIVEGVGGLMVPLDRDVLLIDLIKRFDLPVILVAGNKLGCINQTLLSVEALKSRKINLVGAIFNNSSERAGSERILRDNPKIVRSVSGIEILGTLRYSKNEGSLHRQFAGIGKAIEARL